MVPPQILFLSTQYKKNPLLSREYVRVSFLHIKSLSADVILSAAKDPGAEDAASLDVSLRST